MSAAGLARPAAAEYFYVNRQTQVPGDFVAAAGGQYPGGNGGAIFENSPNAAGNATTTTATSTSTSTSSTGTSSSTASGAASAAAGGGVLRLGDLMTVGALGAAVWGAYMML